MLKQRSPVIHIGLPKTGSTFLQRRVFPLIHASNFYSSYNNSLPNSLGWVYRINGPWLASGLSRGALRSKLEEAFEREMRNLSLSASREGCQSAVGRFLLISSEGLVGVSSDPMLNADLCAELIRSQYPNARIVLILRRQDTWCASIYRQLVFAEDRYRRFIPFDEFFCLNDNDGLCRVPVSVLAWDRLVETYQRVFGKSCVCVLPFELLLADAKAFVSLVCDFLEVDVPPGIDLDVRENSQPPLSVYRRGPLPQRLRKVLGGLRDRNGRFLYETSGLINDVKTMYKHEGRVYQPPKPAVLASIMHNLKEQNLRLSSLCGRDFGEYGYH
jgi:hypothetical protein